MKHLKKHCSVWRSALITAVLSFVAGLLLIFLLFRPEENVRPLYVIEQNIPSQDSIRRAEEQFLVAKVVNVLEPLVGKGNVRAEVRLDLDFNTVTTDEEIFDPDGQVLRSYSAERNFASKAEYEVNKFSRRIVKSGARLKRLSALILVDGVGDGDVYRERSRTELARLAALAAPVIGFDARRGDTLQVESIRFINRDAGLSAVEGLEIVLLAGLCIGLAVLAFHPRQKIDKHQLSPAEQFVKEGMQNPQEKTFASIWKKLENADAQMLTVYLGKECPAAAAYVISRLNPQTAATVVAGFEPVFAGEVVSCLSKMTSVAPEIATEIEQTLERDFTDSPRGGYRYVRQLFKTMEFRRQKELLAVLEKEDKFTAEKIRAGMFNFEDFRAVDNNDIHRLFDDVEADRLALALRGASEDVQKHMFANMTPDAAITIHEEMAVLGPVRLREVEAAQDDIIEVACRLAAAGKITLRKLNGENIR